MVKGVVAAGSPGTARAGASMFALGGNAVDAAVAAGFAATVCETLVVNIGAGGFALVVDGDSPQAAPISYDFFSTVPSPRAEAERDFHKIDIDFGGEVQAFHIGRASTAVPGLVAGLFTMAKQKGRLPLDVLMQPAIRLAHEGYCFTPFIASVMRLLEPIYRDTPEVAAIFAPGGVLLAEGDRLRMPALGDCLGRLAVEGPDLFYRGALARDIVSDQRRHGGMITAMDLESYQVLELKPISVTYRGYRVLLPPPCSHGGILTAFALRLLGSVSLDGLEHNGFEHVRILGHVIRLANAARHDWHGHNTIKPMEINSFLNDDHLTRYADQLHRVLAGEAFTPGIPVNPGPGNTTQISVMDEDGLAVSMTISSGESAGYLVGETGISLNNMLGEADLNPHGFHKDPPGSRLISMMCPTVVLKDGAPVLATGSAGSNRIRSAILQTISNFIDFGLSPHDQVNRARVHHENGILHLEQGIASSVGPKLATTGFRPKIWDRRSLYFGGAQVVTRNEGVLDGGADERRGGHVSRA